LKTDMQALVEQLSAQGLIQLDDHDL
jgi:hypothetical protein